MEFESLVVYGIEFFVITTLFVLIILFFVRMLRNRSEKKQEYAIAVIQEALPEYLYTLDPAYLEILEPYTKSGSGRDLLIEYLIDIHSELNGTIKQAAKSLYFDLGLQSDSESKMKSLRWFEKVAGIKETTLMENSDGYELVKDCLSHSDPEVRRSAKIGMVELKKIKGLKDLALVNDPLSDWLFMSIHSILSRHPYKIRKKDLKILKEANNPSVRKLARLLNSLSTDNLITVEDQ